MNNTSKNISNKVYVGIDVHKRTYSVTVLGKQILKKKATMPAKPESLISFLKNNYSIEEIYSAYEAGFSGFPLQRRACHRNVRVIR